MLQKRKILKMSNKGPKIKYHEKSCATCNNFAINNDNGNRQDISYCPLIGSLACSMDVEKLVGWAREKVCDEWRKQEEGYSYFVRDPFKEV